MYNIACKPLKNLWEFWAWCTSVLVYLLFELSVDIGSFDWWIWLAFQLFSCSWAPKAWLWVDLTFHVDTAVVIVVFLFLLPLYLNYLYRDQLDVLIKKYKKAKSNLENLAKLKASTLHGVDATKMKLHPDLRMRKFDRIIFNFPHAGFHGKEDNIKLIE
jgi:hypothetical protein